MLNLEKYGQNLVVEVICYLFIVLFVYAAVSKLLDFEQFSIELGKSPLLTNFSQIIPWAIPGLELIISISLMIPALKFTGLHFAFGIMVMFTGYIIVVLNFTSHIPCSCGGVLENLGWDEHLLFNIIFILLAMVGIVVHTNLKKSSI